MTYPAFIFSGMFIVMGIAFIVWPKYFVEDGIGIMKDYVGGTNERSVLKRSLDSKWLRWGLLVWIRVGGFLLLAIGIWMLIRNR